MVQIPYLGKVLFLRHDLKSSWQIIVAGIYPRILTNFRFVEEDWVLQRQERL